MPQSNRASLWNALSATGDLSHHFLSDDNATITFGELVRGSCLDGRAGGLRGRSVLVSTKSQLAAAITLIELDGVARRIVLCPPDLASEHLPFVIDSAAVDAIVSDVATTGLEIPGVECFITCSPKTVSEDYHRAGPCQTEWILLTSGTTGLPKMVVHTLASLAGAIRYGTASTSPIIWSTFYDIRRYGGLQIFLRAVLTGTSLVLSSARESTADFLARAGLHGVTHISGTPSHWRRALMSPSAHMIAPQYVRLSGEIADQTILNHLRSTYPEAGVAHAFASTEAGVAFEVSDGMAGFPASLMCEGIDVRMKVEDDTLRICSTRIADRYLGREARPLSGADGFVDTGDLLELHDGRYYFTGRRDGVINIGGLKVHPEEVEAAINRHPEVRMSLVRKKKSPITGAIVVAEVVLIAPADSSQAGKFKDEILQLCRGVLPRHKVPAAIRFVDNLPVAATGKVVRDYA
jgi:acyl-coenzyme A synthetase/AMP-(fatty) acid ligase